MLRTFVTQIRVLRLLMLFFCEDELLIGGELSSSETLIYWCVER